MHHPSGSAQDRQPTPAQRVSIGIPNPARDWLSTSLLGEPLRRVVAKHDPDLAVADARPLSVDAARSIDVPRFGAWLFAAAAAILSGIGIYGVMAYAGATRSPCAWHSAPRRGRRRGSFCAAVCY